jgi:hypothetical protein
MIGIRRFELQQLRQGSGTGLMHGGTNRCLSTLQIEAAGGVAVAATTPAAATPPPGAPS